jgi:hypothetical protein
MWHFLQLDVCFICRCGHLQSWHRSYSQHSSTNGTCSHTFLELLSFVYCNRDHNTSGYIHPSPGMSYCTSYPEYLQTHKLERCEFVSIYACLVQTVLLNSVEYISLVWKTDQINYSRHTSNYNLDLASVHTNKQTPWPESASELYQPSDRRFSAKWLPTFADKGCHVDSVTDPYGRIFGFLDRSRYFSIK